VIIEENGAILGDEEKGRALELMLLDNRSVGDCGAIPEPFRRRSRAIPGVG
jgi:hypothetical protein